MPFVYFMLEASKQNCHHFDLDLNSQFFKIYFLDHPIHPPRTETDPWECPVLEDCGYKVKLSKGVFQIYKNEEDLQEDKPINFDVPDLETFVTDMQHMCAMIADGPLKSFCYRRLSYLQSKYQLHVLLNELRELAAQKAVPHRDFYNCRKVNTNKGNSKLFCCYETFFARLTHIFTLLLA